MNEPSSPSAPPKYARLALVAGVLLILVCGGLGAYSLVKGRTGGTIASTGNLDSLDPVSKGQALTGGTCTGKGSTELTAALMRPQDIGSIAPLGQMAGQQVIPGGYQNYVPVDPTKAADTYPVYAVMDGSITGVGQVQGGAPSWNFTLSYTCTFMASYGLLTSLAPDIAAQLPMDWQAHGGVRIAVKAGDLVGYAGGQGVDFLLANTTSTTPSLLYHTAYNNRLPFLINGVYPLDYLTDDIKKQLLPKYLRSTEPQDGQFAYDVTGQAVGNWFKVGTNGAAGSDSSGSPADSSGYLSLSYNPIDPTALELSSGSSEGKPAQFAVKSMVDWNQVTPQSGLAKVELDQGNLVTPAGAVWTGGYSAGLKFIPGTLLATALVQMTDATHLKIEVFPGKDPSEVTAFTGAALMYDRGQDAHMVTK